MLITSAYLLSKEFNFTNLLPVRKSGNKMLQTKGANLIFATSNVSLDDRQAVEEIHWTGSPVDRQPAQQTNFLG